MEEELVRRAHALSDGFRELKRRHDAFMADPSAIPPVLVVHDRHLELAALVEDLAVQVSDLAKRIAALENYHVRDNIFEIGRA